VSQDDQSVSCLHIPLQENGSTPVFMNIVTLIPLLYRGNLPTPIYTEVRTIGYIPWQLLWFLRRSAGECKAGNSDLKVINHPEFSTCFIIWMVQEFFKILLY
jgi:hypothetical protein